MSESKLDLSQVPFEPYYRDEHCVIYNTDCRKVLPFLPKFDLLLTDPPYGIKMARRGTIGTSKAGKVKDYGKSDWDDAPPDTWLLEQMIGSAEHAIVWGGNYFGLEPSSCWAVWDKDNTGDFADCELAWTNIDKAVRKFKFRWNGMLQERMGDQKEVRIHPTQKPVPLFRWCLGNFCKSDTIRAVARLKQKEKASSLAGRLSDHFLGCLGRDGSLHLPFKFSLVSDTAASTLL